MIQTLLPVIGPIIDKLIDRIPDPAAREKARLEAEATLLAASIEEMRGQVEINKVEAGNASVFVAGWRPAIGWVCAAAVAYTYLLVPVGMWLSFLVGKPIAKPPVLDANLWELMFAMLGLGGLRTFEKIKGVASK